MNFVSGTRPAVWLSHEALRLNLHNVGRGPALNITATLATDDDEKWEERGALSRGHAVLSDVVAPDAQTIIQWAGFKSPRDPGDKQWLVSARDGVLTYWDVAYRRHETFFTLFFGPDGVGLADQRFMGTRRLPTSRAVLKARTTWWLVKSRRTARRAWRRVRGLDPRTGRRPGNPPGGTKTA